MEKFPLHWPATYKRTGNRMDSRFKSSTEKAQQLLTAELKRLGASGIIISSNVRIRNDGFMYTGEMNKIHEDPGVAVYFKYKKKDLVMCCDQYRRVWENVYALARSIDALRGIDRWGCSDFIEKAFSGFTALPAPEQEKEQSWWEVLGVTKDASEEEIKNAFRTLAKIHHPDNGGSAGMFHIINSAYQQSVK